MKKTLKEIQHQRLWSENLESKRPHQTLSFGRSRPLKRISAPCLRIRVPANRKFRPNVNFYWLLTEILGDQIRYWFCSGNWEKQSGSLPINHLEGKLTSNTIQPTSFSRIEWKVSFWRNCDTTTVQQWNTKICYQTSQWRSNFHRDWDI